MDEESKNMAKRICLIPVLQILDTLLVKEKKDKTFLFSCSCPSCEHGSKLAE